MGINIWHSVIHPITRHFRKSRGRFLLEKFPNIAEYKICDLGGSRHFWDKISVGIPTENITIVNVSDGETQSVSGTTDGSYKFVLYDGINIPFSDKSFDLLICNSVLEHVPPKNREILAAEIDRVSKQVFIQTPAQEFPIEPHFLLPFIHWLPRKIGYHIVKISPWRILSKPSIDTLNSYYHGTILLNKNEIRKLFPSYEIHLEKFLGLTKSYYLMRKHT